MDYRCKITLTNGENVVIEEENIECVLKDDILYFTLGDMSHTLDFKNKTFLRENDDYSFLLDIENEKSEINLKKEQYNLQVLVEYANLLKNKNDIQLSYFIETDNNENVLKIELIGEE